MSHASSTSTSHSGHDRAAGSPHVGSKPSRREVNAIEFGMFAETLRQDLAPMSLLEHVLAERVVLAAWRLHVASVQETKSAEAGAALKPASRAAGPRRIRPGSGDHVARGCPPRSKRAMGTCKSHGLPGDGSVRNCGRQPRGSVVATGLRCGGPLERVGTH